MHITNIAILQLMQMGFLVTAGAIEMRTHVMMKIAPAVVWEYMLIIIALGNLIWIGVAVYRNEPMPTQSPRLPNLAQTVRSKLFPPPASVRHQYQYRQRRVRKEVAP